MTSLFDPSVIRAFHNLERLSLVGRNGENGENGDRIETCSKIKTVISFLTAFKAGGLHRLKQFTIIGRNKENIIINNQYNQYHLIEKGCYFLSVECRQQAHQNTIWRVDMKSRLSMMMKMMMTMMNSVGQY